MALLRMSFLSTWFGEGAEFSVGLDDIVKSKVLDAHYHETKTFL